MSRVDNRVVEMRFDNQQFESGVRTSISSLDKLKSSLNLEGSAKGLNELSKAGQTFNLNSISESLDLISSRFTNMGLIGVTALQNITNAAINAGSQMVKALAIDPIKTGFNEYELKMGSIQTIMAGTGESLETVNKYLNELNEYSDKTIYSFADMTQNIGKFTNAGVSLKDSVAAIKGVSNVAAISGANANEASRAMYNFAQALSSGTVKLMDWKSIELANMGTMEFKKQLIESAEAMGTLKKNADGTYTTLKGNTLSAMKGFNEALADGWLTTDALVGTLKEYADANTEIGKKAMIAAQEVKTLTQLFDTMKESVQSGWAMSWEYIIGDKNQAVEMLTNMNIAFSNIVTSSSDARNKVLSFWNANGGRAAMIEGLSAAFKNLQKILEPIGDAFTKLFPPITGEQLVDFSKKFRDFMVNIKIEEPVIVNLRKTFEGFFAILSIGKQAIGALLRAFGGLAKAMSPVAGSILEVTASFGEYLVHLDSVIRESKSFDMLFAGIGSAAEPIAERIKQAFKKITDALTMILEFFKPASTRMSDGMTAVFQTLGLSLEEGSKAASGFDLLRQKFEGPLTTMRENFDRFCDAMDRVKERLAAAFASFDFGEFFKVVTTGVAVGSLAMISKGLYDLFHGGGNFLKSLVGVLDGVRETLEAYQTQLKAGALLRIAGAVAILAGALLILSQIDQSKLKGSLAAITVLFADLFASMAVFQKVAGFNGTKDLVFLSAAMVGVATAVLILAKAMKAIEELDWDEVKRGLVTIGTLSGLVIILAERLGENKGTLLKSSLGLNAFATAIRILVGVVKMIGELEPKVLIQGMIGMGAIVAELMIFLRVVGDKSTFNFSAGMGLLAMAAAINLLYLAVNQFAQMDPAKLILGMTTVMALMAAMSMFLQSTKDVTGAVKTATGLLILSAAMLVYSVAVERLGTLPIPVIVTGLAAMASILAIVAIAVSKMPPNLIPMSLGLVAVSIALVILAKALEKIGELSLAEIGKGLLAFGGTMAILAVGLRAMTNVVPGILALGLAAGVMYALSFAMKALGSLQLETIGKALLTLVGVFVAIGVAGAVLGPLVPVIISLAVAIALIGASVGAIGFGLGAFANGIAALSEVGPEGLQTLRDLLGLIPEAIRECLDAFIEAIPKFVEATMLLLISILDAVVKTLPELMKKGADLIIAFLKGMTDEFPRVVQAAFTMVITFINGFADALRLNAQIMADAIKNLMTALFETGLKVILGMLDAYKYAAETLVKSGLINGLLSKMQELKDGFKLIVKNALEGVKAMLSDFVQLGKDAVAGFVAGIKSLASSALKAGKDLARAAITGTKTAQDSNSPSKKFAELGTFAGQGYVQGIKNMSSKVVEAGASVGKDALSAMREAISKVADVVNADPTLTPTIRPVIDMDDVQKKIDGTFSSRRVLAVETAIEKSRQVAARTSSKGESDVGASINAPDQRQTTIQVVNHYNVRNDSDIRKISSDLQNTLDRYNMAKGVPAL